MHNEHLIIQNQAILKDMRIEIYEDECRNTYEREIIFPEYLKN